MSQSQFRHFCVCERFIYYQDKSTNSLQLNRKTSHGNIEIAHRHMNVEIELKAVQFLFLNSFQIVYYLGLCYLI
jgi:hypothetical protein